MKTLLFNGKVIGKTKTDFPLAEGLTSVDFDPTNPDHKKAKFLTELPTETKGGLLK